MFDKKIKSIFTLIRPQQYSKNVFIFLPLFFVGQFTNTELLLKTFIAFVSFSLSASAIYILNDYKDIKEDRRHPKKKFRPLASGSISKNMALTLMVILLTVGLLLMIITSLYASIILGIYIILNVAYCFKLKQIALLDITIIATGFVLRLFVGSFVTATTLTMWIVIMTFLLALFLALAKRRDDILLLYETGKKMRKSIKGYNLKLIDGTMMIMASIVIVVYILYTTSQEIIEKFHSEHLYLTTLFVIFGIMRYLQISFVEKHSGSPTEILLRDKFTIINLILWMVSFAWFIYIIPTS